jgi:hypothetical protein
MDWFNFYSVTVLLALIMMGVFLYYVYDIMAFQNAAAPWPPTGAAPTPDGWTLDSAGWAIIPAADLVCSAVGTTPAPYTNGWQTVGSAPSAWKSDAAPAPCAFNVGLLHPTSANATDAHYTAIAAMLPAVHKTSTTDPSGFTTTGIVKADYRSGLVSVDFSIDPSEKDVKSATEKRRKFCVTYGVFWDGVADPEEVRAVLIRQRQ